MANQIAAHWLTQKKKLISKVWKRDKQLFLMFMPIFAYFIIFNYIPITGAIIAFKEFTPGTGIYGGEWVGLKWIIQFFHSAFAYRLIRNTVLIAFYSILFGFPIPIIFAVCITEINNNKFRRLVQTASYLPHFISTVVLVGMVKSFLAVNDGVINNMLYALGFERINFMMDRRWFRTIYISSGIWQGFGYSSIIYIAAILNIDPSLYESAKIDGITKFKEVWYITLPSILPTVIVLFILRLGRIMSVGFEKVYLMYNPLTYETADVISTYIYRRGIELSNYSFSAAVGLFNSVINFAFVFCSNKLSRKITNMSLW